MGALAEKHREQSFHEDIRKNSFWWEMLLWGGGGGGYCGDTSTRAKFFRSAGCNRILNLGAETLDPLAEQSVV